MPAGSANTRIACTNPVTPHDPAIAPISSPKIEATAAALDIRDWEFHRTHWAVKDVDLYRVLDQEISARVRPKVFQFPASELFDPDLVAVMMPFSPGFAPVYESLKERNPAARHAWRQG